MKRIVIALSFLGPLLATGDDGVAVTPVHRPLIEEYTGLWCGYCPKGYIAMEMIEEIYGDRQVTITYHNNDPMEVTAVYAMNVQGLPTGSVDRRRLIDPYYGEIDEDFGIAKEIERALAQPAPASIEVSGYIGPDFVSATATVEFTDDVPAANYMIGYVLTRSGLSSPMWSQTNYYSGTSGLEGTPLEVLTHWGWAVRGLVYNDVAIDVGGMRGVKGSLPENIEAGRQYSHRRIFDISNNLYANPKNRLAVAAFIVDGRTGRVVNAAKCDFADYVDPSGVTAVDADEAPAEYYDLQGRRVERPAAGIYIIKEGSTVRKTVIH